MNPELAQLKHDFDTQTPRRTPAWTDDLSAVELRQIEERIANRAQFRRLISERPLGAGRGKS